MKRNIIVTALLLVTTALSSCNFSDGNEMYEIPAEYDEYFEYSAPRIKDGYYLSSDFAVDEDGNLYTLSFRQGETVQKLDYINMKGEITASYDLSFTINGDFDVKNGIIYFLTYMNGTNAFCSFEPGINEINMICTAEEFGSLDKVEIAEGYSYLFGVSSKRIGVEGEYKDITHNGAASYFYGGEKLIKVDLETGKAENSAVKFPIAFSVYNKKCTVYAADKDGYYFCNFDGDSRLPHDITGLDCFDLYSENKYVFLSSSGMNISNVNAGTTNANDGISQVLTERENGRFGFILTKKIVTRNGYTYYFTQDSEGNDTICRFYNASYIKKNNKIKFISTDLNNDVPFGCGYTIDYNELSGEEFSLAVLSQDRNYDLCVINSYQNISSNLRDKGSFYPLSDVPNVQDYIDRCFPYLKEAAINKDGEIWMLPVSLDIPVVLYDPSSCEQHRVDIRSVYNIGEFIDLCQKIDETGHSDGIAVHPYPLIQNLLMRYLAENTSFDTEEFRELAVLIKEKINISDTEKYPSYLPVINIALSNLVQDDSENPNFLFSCLYDSSGEVYYYETYPFRATELPDAGAASCVFLTVNPSSENLDSTLDYISSLCEHLMTQNNSFLLSDRSTYTDTECMSDICDIYEKSHICFNISEEIIYTDLVKYMSGGITLDELINEGDRKLKTYLNE